MKPSEIGQSAARAGIDVDAHSLFVLFVGLVGVWPFVSTGTLRAVCTGVVWRG